MAKTSKNQMKVKGTLKNYIATWKYSKSLSDWSKEALVANIEFGIKYAVKQKIKTQVLDDERNVGRSAGILNGMLKLANGDPEQLKLVALICKQQNIRTEIQLEYIINEEDYFTAPEVPEGEDDDDDEDNDGSEDESAENDESENA